MVKIRNTLGDVKIGRQGEVVYQRKYGEQIRRMASPKRAIPSQTQIAHRQLYRDALTWRSGLSLANRRYLDGYCIANGVVDRYHIPLPWSRFALKIYLQAVKFVVIEKPLLPPPPPLTKFESYETGDDQGFSIRPPYIAGHTFTPLVSHIFSIFIIKAHRYGSPPPMLVSLFECDANHYPTGDPLATVWWDFSSLTPTLPGVWVPIDLPDAPLVADQEYIVTISNSNGSGVNSIRWRMDASNPTYPRGMHVYSTDNGETWIAYPPTDQMFQEWGYPPAGTPTPGILHVRHPALLTVVHKQGELPINAYYNLSSLDNEYLTKQVGLDVLSGDKIEATTVAGILYKHQV